MCIVHAVCSYGQRVGSGDMVRLVAHCYPWLCIQYNGMYLESYRMYIVVIWSLVDYYVLTFDNLFVLS